MRDRHGNWHGGDGRFSSRGRAPAGDFSLDDLNHDPLPEEEEEAWASGAAIDDEVRSNTVKGVIRSLYPGRQGEEMIERLYATPSAPTPAKPVARQQVPGPGKAVHTTGLPRPLTQESLQAWLNENVSTGYVDDIGDWDEWPNDSSLCVVAFDEPTETPFGAFTYHLSSEGAMGPDGYDFGAPSPVNPIPGPDGNTLAQAWVMSVDTTKSRRSSYDWVESLPDTIAEGSPVRSTNRSGPGTKGTRAVSGVGRKPVVAWN